MIATAIEQVGPWIWWIVGIVLLIAEVVVPGVFFVWIGIAAIIIGAISLLHWGGPWWGWQIQLVAFAILSVLSAFAGRQMMSGKGSESDQPLLNKRGQSLVGRTATLQQPIRDGRGRIQLDDTWWVVNGPDLEAGTRVRVVEASGRELGVEAA